MFLSTCNRVEFFFRANIEVNDSFIFDFLKSHYSEINDETLTLASENARVFSGLDAIRHLFHVTSSLDSLVVGEREIITQVRLAYERASEQGWTGDYLRLAVQKSIETAKQIYTETEIATKPVSVVNLAYRKLIERDLDRNQNLLIIGAGTTIEAISGNLKIHGFKSVKVFNRTLANAEKIATALKGEAYTLDQLEEKAGDHDVIISCTGAERAIIDREVYEKLQKRSPGRKIAVDLAIPNDIDPTLKHEFDLDYISIDDLREEAKQNLKEREKEVFRCEALVENRLKEFVEAFRTRKLEIAMRQVPLTMKDIRKQAVESTFAREIGEMNQKDRETLDRIVAYLEKKYISVPMKMAREIVLDQDLKDSIID